MYCDGRPILMRNLLPLLFCRKYILLVDYPIIIIRRKVDRQVPSVREQSYCEEQLLSSYLYLNRRAGKSNENVILLSSFLASWKGVCVSSFPRCPFHVSCLSACPSFFFSHQLYLYRSFGPAFFTSLPPLFCSS